MLKRRLEILTTGGTIASRTRGPMASGDEVAGELREAFPDIDIVIREICRRGSSQITTEILRDIGSQVETAFANGATGVIVTHGTDTLEETAYFLDLVGGSLGPTVVTGAMRGLDAVAPDGLANLTESCKVALEPASGAYGVLVVLNDRIHLAREVTKVHSWLLDAFDSPACGPIGFVGPDGVRFTVGPLKRSRTTYESLVTPVDLIKTSLDSGDRLVRAALATGTKGLVIESLGHGHLPPGLTAALKDATEQGIPVVITTRCLSGGAPMPGTLQTRGLRPRTAFITTDLSGPKARIKLMLALSVTNDVGEIAAIFAQHP